MILECCGLDDNKQELCRATVANLTLDDMTESIEKKIGVTSLSLWVTDEDDITN